MQSAFQAQERTQVMNDSVLGGVMYHWHFNKASGDVTAQFNNGTGRGVFVEDN